ncbi:L,D-transpeptidase family protein [Flexibacterium corallicola]|uniref:L,D-transpeptidase family protein n=1 Tax=Flexibacterium corallicola TaxID=3037259 RepID=UPI00286F2B61|nr:L,D-transpeptidase family protein [Pseudovibrio sp. M1P-2-3]
MTLTLSPPLHSKDPRALLVRPDPSNPCRATIQWGDKTFPCALGKGGITTKKREGDGATPVGYFEILDVYYRADRVTMPETALRHEPLSPNDGWCDDTELENYNRPVKLPFDGSHEKMWREDNLYDIVVVLNCNMFPANRGDGSAIFFHLAKEGFQATLGCVAVELETMKFLLKELRAGDSLQVAQS